MSFSETRNWTWLYTIIACPRCRAKLVTASGMLRCPKCGTEFTQTSDAWVNLDPGHLAKPGMEEWALRQEEMEGWYRDLISVPERAADSFQFDYTPYAKMLRTLGGVVLDLGGGVGVTRHFLSAATHYVVLYPSLEWLSGDWTMLSKKFPSFSSAPYFVRGIGERMPFLDGSFDSVVALWSLNHVRDPAVVMSEVHRVLVPGGRFVITLEDMIPRWRDTLSPVRRFAGERQCVVLPVNLFGMRSCRRVSSLTASVGRERSFVKHG